jgi:hypothetical protein
MELALRRMVVPHQFFRLAANPLHQSVRFSDSDRKI